MTTYNSDTVSILAILKLKKLLSDVVLCDGALNGQQVDAKRLQQLADTLWAVLPADVLRDTVLESVRYLFEEVLTQQLIEDLCHRLAGNLPQLRSGKAVLPWRSQRTEEWVPLQIVSCRRVYGSAGKPAALFGFKVLAGTPCPLIILRTWSLRLCRGYMSRFFGFSRNYGTRQGRYPFSQPEEFVSLRCYGRVAPDTCTKELMFDDIDFSSALNAWNREQLKRRFRVDKRYACPEGHPREFPCYLCPVSYLRCPASVHREEWRLALCEKCKEPEAYFDSTIARDMCIDCYNRRISKGF